MKAGDKIKIIVEKTDTGFSGYCADFPVFTTADNIPELLSNALEAVQLYFEEAEKIPDGDDLQFEIDFRQFFQYYRVLNAGFLAERIGMNPTLLSQYVQGHKKPSAKQTLRILDGIHQIGKELSEIKLIFQ